MIANSVSGRLSVGVEEAFLKRLFLLRLSLKGQGYSGKQTTEAGVAGESIHACAARTARAEAPPGTDWKRAGVG